MLQGVNITAEKLYKYRFNPLFLSDWVETKKLFWENPFLRRKLQNKELPIVPLLWCNRLAVSEEFHTLTDVVQWGPNWEPVGHI